METLTYLEGDHYFPLPPHELGLQTVKAEPWVHPGDKPFAQHMEGLCFDREGKYLYFCLIGEGKVGRVDMDTEEYEIIYHDPAKHPVSVRIHQNGQLFVSSFAMGMNGGVFVMNPDGSDVRQIIANELVDDLIFMPDGGFYYTVCDGNYYNRTGSVKYCTPDYKSTKMFIPNLASANGIALNKQKTHLWVTEYMGGRLHRFALNPGPSVTQTSSVVYHFTGTHGPDSCSIDNYGNVYVALQGQGRVMVFNSHGMPIGNILLPDRETGHNLCCSSVMVRPGTKETYISTCDDAGSGPWIFKASAFAVGNEEMYQFSKIGSYDFNQE